MTSMQTVVAGSVEYITVTVTADVPLSTQTVALSVDRGVTWLDCSWTGSPDTTRKARTNTPLTFAAGKTLPVLVRVENPPETHIVRAGSITVS